MTSGKTLFYPCWISNHAGQGRDSLMWGRPCDQPSEARDLGKAEVDAGNASLAFVVRFAGGQRTPLANFVYPRAARRIIEHWEALWNATK